MPPTGVVASDSATATSSSVFCTLILDAVGWESAFPNLPRSDEWTRLVGRLAHVFREAGISWEVVGDYILEAAVHPFHFSGWRQEELIELDQQVRQEVQLFVANMVAAFRQGQTSRTSQRMGSLCYRGGGGGGDGTAVAGVMGAAVPEACDAPMVEAEKDEVEEHALLRPSALEAFLRGLEVGTSHLVQRIALGSDLNSLELEALGRGLEWPERIVSEEDVVFLSDEEGWPTIRIGAGTLMALSLRAVFDADRREGGALPAKVVMAEYAVAEGNVEDLSDVFEYPFSSARHVPKRAKDEFAGVVRWVLRNLNGDSEDFWRLLGMAPRMLMVPPPGARKKSIPAELVARASEEQVMSDVISLVKEGQLGKAVRRLDPGVLAPLTPETLEALQALHPVGDGLLASV
ncbi:hypothetical protein CYMTET_22094 [Cymbomonas tetramitiformis]|uniref:Uncharacterized protein n=1 Tax=Cymbomonas tetramitiformis TaxID=36881 RepID=A0AAE0G0K8_9CHLO|nr:hypothetical protein CYMTET_22094 [Cymbomonas tetramitiformis]